MWREQIPRIQFTARSFFFLFFLRRKRNASSPNHREEFLPLRWRNNLRGQTPRVLFARAHFWSFFIKTRRFLSTYSTYIRLVKVTLNVENGGHRFAIYHGKRKKKIVVNIHIRSSNYNYRNNESGDLWVTLDFGFFLLLSFGVAFGVQEKSISWAFSFSSASEKLPS